MQNPPPQQLPLPQHLQQHLQTLTQAITQKNEIIEHLTSRIHNQQKQIDLLVLDAEEKHYHQITKYYMKSINKYMKYDKYLLVKIDADDVGADVYMSKFVKIVHFGELEVVGGGVGGARRGYEQGERELWGQQGVNSNLNINGNISENNEKERQNQGIGRKQPNVVGLKQVNMNKKESNSFQLSCKGLSLQIQELKQKLKAYTTMVTQKSASKMQKTDKKQTEQKQKSERSLKNKAIQPENIPQFSPNSSLATPFQKLQPLNQNPPYMSQSQKKIQGLQLKTLRDKKREGNEEIKVQQKDQDKNKNKQKGIEGVNKDIVDVSAFQSDISPLKKKGNTKTIFIRKR